MYHTEPRPPSCACGMENFSMVISSLQWWLHLKFKKAGHIHCQDHSHLMRQASPHSYGCIWTPVLLPPWPTTSRPCLLFAGWFSFLWLLSQTHSLDTVILPLLAGLKLILAVKTEPAGESLRTLKSWSGGWRLTLIALSSFLNIYLIIWSMYTRYNFLTMLYYV